MVKIKIKIVGRPGWHIECSAMSMKYLGETFDIHTGGVDLIFPHHENEIAQSEGATGKKFVNYWLHAEHLLVDGKKMSKSLGNFYTLRDLLKKRYDARAIRYLLLSAHYRQQLNFTFQALESAKKTVDGLFNFIRRLNDVKGRKNNPKVNELIKKVKEEFGEAMDDNLNINIALASMFEFIKEINKLIDDNKLSRKNAKDVVTAMLDFDKILGLNLEGAKKEKLSKEVEKMIQAREEARRIGDYRTADEIRKRLKEEFGVVLEDTKKGVKWKVT